MSTREDLQQWVIDALNANGGQASIVEVCMHIWNHKEQALRGSGDLFYTWQYDVRWAATSLRKIGKLKENAKGKDWTLT